MAKLQDTRIFGDLIIDGLLIGGDVNSVQVFTTGSSATYTAPINLKRAIVFATGAGGGGGAASGPFLMPPLVLEVVEVLLEVRQ